MSAVAAVLGWPCERAGATDVPTQAGVCAAMLGAMDHRGRTRWQATADAAVLGARSDSAGCFAAADGIRVTLDGAIHNRAELDLDVSANDDDAMLVLRGYQRWGVEGVRRLIGDFAFVLYDERQRCLLAARDALGNRPLYFHRSADGVRVASEAQALRAAGVASEPNTLAVALFIASSFTEEGHTLRRHIEAVPPGHLLLATSDRVELRPYWTPDPWRKLDVDNAEASALFGDTFREAIRCRLPRDGTLGVMLSGGLDSSAIACQAAALEAAPTALHCSLTGWDCDETSVSQAVSGMWDMPSIMVTGDGDEMTAACRPRTKHPDLLYHASGACFDALFAKAGHAGIHTVMTGLGGDQMVDETGGECADAVRQGKLREVATISGLDRQPLSATSYRQLWYGLRRAVPPRLRFATRHVRRRPKPRFLTPAWGRRVREHVDATQRRRLASERWPDESSAAMCAFLRQYGVRVGAAQVGLAGVLHGVDVAHPFQDRRVFELALAMPRRQKLRRGWRKRKPMLRRAMAKLLPQEVAGRRDAAEFSCYLRDVYLRHHRREIAALFGDSRLAELGIIDIREVQSALDAGLPNASLIIHFGLILSMELWLRQDWS